MTLQFPDGPKLELDELIDQLVERAHQVKGAQGRLRSLLRAMQTVTGDLSLETVLHNIVGAACELSEARYGALGVLGPEGGLETLVHVGMDDRTVAGISHFPQGKGLIGALITDPSPVRLEQLADDDRSSGTPDGHPPMTSFLGVPIHVRDRVFGNLYLADSARGRFTADDEELVVALALAAGTAISNARLYHESRQQQRWLRASVEIGSSLLSTGADPMPTVAQQALDLAEADLVTVGLLTADRREVVVEVALGAGADDLVAQRMPVADTAGATAVAEQRPVALRTGAGVGDPAQYGAVVEPGPVLVLPLQGGSQVRGVLTLTRRRGRPQFSPVELEMAAGFAAHASVALELADSRTTEKKVVLLEDRDRIARDLHDHVIQELFAIGLRLESVAGGLGAGSEAGRKISDRVEDLDRTIRRIRTSIFALRGPLDVNADGLRQQILEIASDLTPALGFPAHVSFAGPVDVSTEPGLADDITAVVREALTNAAKHAAATAASVDISAGPSEIVVTVLDNGTGLGDPTRSSGLGNMQARAEQHGGTLTVGPAVGGGTMLIWKARLL